MIGCAYIPYEQFVTSPETIEQELQPAVCKQLLPHIRRIIVYILAYLHRENVSGRKIEGDFERECDREG